MKTDCKICGAMVPRARQTYCSVKCRSVARTTATVAPCEHCGRDMRVYKHLTGKRRFCSSACHNDAMRILGPRRDCEHCGRTFSVTRLTVSGRSNGQLSRQRFCSGTCRNLARAAVGTIDKHGYRLISVPGRGAVPEHRLVMEKMIGRRLRADETVHHKNGDRAFNDPDNLELWNSRHGRGQRVEDKVEFSLNFVRDYGFTVTQTPLSDAIAGICGLI